MGRHWGRRRLPDSLAVLFRHRGALWRGRNLRAGAAVAGPVAVASSLADNLAVSILVDNTFRGGNDFEGALGVVDDGP